MAEASLGARQRRWSSRVWILTMEGDGSVVWRLVWRLVV
uniref:Uncharacterized protein n=1 Tax=Arundo donax TaxID=35708 RepID=A0A0A9CFV4_ARUDO